MKTINFLKTSMAIAIMFGIGACSKNGDKNIAQQDHPKIITEEMMSENGANPDEASISENASNTNAELNSPVREDRNSNHFLYTESNSTERNTILVYKVRHNGTLDFKGATASGGTGTGQSLGSSQGALVLDKNHQWLYAVNAGSNSVSSFKVHNDGSVTLAHTAGTDGTKPVSLSVHNNMLYVLNNGSDNIHGFWIGEEGALTDIKGSTQSLSGTAVDAPQISFLPNGGWLVVTEKATNLIGTFRVMNDGAAGHGNFTPSVGQTPFGFEFSRGRFMIVSNAAAGAVGAGSATSYITENGVPENINGAIPDFGSAPCWIAITKFGRFAFTTNTAGNTVSSYYVAPWGGLYLVKSEAAKTDMGPVDIVVAANNYYVYVLNFKSQTIGEYHRKLFGELEFIGSASGVPAAATGLATY